MRRCVCDDCKQEALPTSNFCWACQKAMSGDEIDQLRMVLKSRFFGFGFDYWPGVPEGVNKLWVWQDGSGHACKPAGRAVLVLMNMELDMAVRAIARDITRRRRRKAARKRLAEIRKRKRA